MNKLEQHLSRAVGQLPHPPLAEVSRIPVLRMTVHDEITRQHPPRRSLFGRIAVGAAVSAAVLLLCLGGGWYAQFRVVASIVDLDVNPGFELTANQRDQVLEITPVNEDAAKHLPDMDFRGMPLGDAVEAVLAALQRTGYLSDPDGVVLLSVGGKNAERVEQALTERIELTLAEQQGGTVVCQSLPDDALLRKEAKGCGVSTGKLALVNEILWQKVAFSRDKLLDMGVGELVALSERHSLALEKATRGLPEQSAPPAVKDNDWDDDGEYDDDDHDDLDNAGDLDDHDDFKDARDLNHSDDDDLDDDDLDDDSDDNEDSDEDDR